MVDARIDRKFVAQLKSQSAWSEATAAALSEGPWLVRDESARGHVAGRRFWDWRKLPARSI